MVPTILMATSAGILLALGGAHLLFTFSGRRLTPRDPALRSHMEKVSPVITGQTTMWKAWIGFNASHSMGAILFGLIYGFLAIRHPALLFGSCFLLGVGAVVLAAYLALALRYWFRVPLTGIALALGCYLLSVLTTRL